MADTAKNVIVFLSDQQRWDTSSIYGNPLDLTPNFDRAALQGTHLYNCFSNQPLCAPARSMLQTGQYATTTGCFRNEIPLPESATNLGKLFSAANIRTGYIGKWHLASAEPVPPQERVGYEYWLASNMLEYTSDAYDTTVYDNDGTARKLPGYRVDALTDAAVRYIDSVKDDRFFLFLSFLEPHHQNHLDNYPGRMGDNERYLGRWTPPDLEVLVGNAPQNLPGYFGMTKRLDDAFGRIMDALYSLGLSDDTAVLYTSDHGNHFRTRNREYKRSCHESSIRVPGVLIGGPFTGGGRVNQLVSTINIAPTLLDAAGLEIPSSFEGQSLLPIVKREPIDWPDDVFVQLSEDDVGRAIRTDRWKYGVLAPQAHGWHDQDAETYEETQLYDLHADPYELNNLAGMTAFAEVATELRQRLIDRIREIEGKAVTINPAPSKHSGRRALIHWNSDTTDSGNALL